MIIGLHSPFRQKLPTKRFESVEEAEIASQIIGRVIEVRVKDGDRVKKGDLLVKLDRHRGSGLADASVRAGW